MVGATDSTNGVQGLVPQPMAGEHLKFLRGDGTWQTPTDNNNKVTQTVSTTNATYPILACATANATATTTTTAIFASAIKINPSAGSLTATAVYNAVWNDYAEFFERAEETEVGDIIALTPKDGKEAYGRATHKTKGHIVGVHSDSFGHLIGGERPENGMDFVEYNLPKFIPVGLIGRVKTKIIGPVKTGDYIVLDERHAGTGRVFNELDRKSDIIGFAVESNDSEEVKLVRIKLSI